MSYIRKLPNGKYRAEISKNYTSIQSKTFPTERNAVEWAKSIEKNIDYILSIKLKTLRKLSPEQVEQMGGVALFQKLGLDIEFVTFKTLVNEYISQWTGKDDSYYLRSAF